MVKRIWGLLADNSDAVNLSFQFHSLSYKLPAWWSGEGENSWVEAWNSSTYFFDAKVGLETRPFRKVHRFPLWLVSALSCCSFSTPYFLGHCFTRRWMCMDEIFQGIIKTNVFNEDHYRELKIVQWNCCPDCRKFEAQRESILSVELRLEIWSILLWLSMTLDTTIDQN